MANDYAHLFTVHMAALHVHYIYMYIKFQRTKNERSAHNQVNIPTIAVEAHEQKTEGSFSLSLAPDSRHDHFQPDYSNYNTYTHALDQLVRKHFITIIIIIYRPPRC